MPVCSRYLGTISHGDIYSIDASSPHGKTMQEPRRSSRAVSLRADCAIYTIREGSFSGGQNQPTITTLFKLCTALKIKPSEMIQEVELAVDN